MNRIQISILSLLLLPGLAGCNDTKPASDTSTFAGLPEHKEEPSGEVGTTVEPKPPVDVILIKDGTITPRPGGFDVQLQKDVLEVRAAAANALRVHFLPEGKASAPTQVIDHNFKMDATFKLEAGSDDKTMRLNADQFSASWDAATSLLTIKNAANEQVMSISTNDLKKGQLIVRHGEADRLYGIGGSGRYEDSRAIYRNYAEGLNTGSQGHAGAPFVWSTAGYGVLVDTMGSSTRKIELRHENLIQFLDTSKKDVDAYLLVGRPAELFGAVAKISGRTPLFPKWSMGLTNSQWGAGTDNKWGPLRKDGQLQGMTEEKFRSIIKQYREYSIPIDAFTFDLDWMFWGGTTSSEIKIPDSQFQWNTERFPGMKADAPKSADQNLRMFAEENGIKLTTILKPRIPFYSAEGRVAESKGYWMPNTEVKQDFFTPAGMRHVDFSRPEVRKWYWEKVKGAFDTGIQGWWNDEADSSDATDDGNETEGTDMQRTVYEGQRAASNQRVWSINRNFYLGAQRYAYTLWSGDIDNGFDSMKIQRHRMLSAINAGATQWTMDAGGFHNGKGTKDGGTGNEDYARWVQFAIFTPIFRLHGENGVERQPWFYKPDDQTVDKMAAVEAIKLRYRLIPYIYSYEHQRKKTGVGIVRPLLFDWPEDEIVSNNVDSWLFGDWLLASPVVEKDQKNKEIYLPAGNWIEWNAGNPQTGGRTMNFGTGKWESNFPLFIRQGAIIPMMHEDVQYVGEKLLKELDVEVFPDTKRTSFEYYDDDGKTYDYEKGVYFLQNLSVQRTGKTVLFETAAPEGGFKPELEYYTVKIHGPFATSVESNGAKLKQVPNLTDLNTAGEGWYSGKDADHGNIDVTYVRIRAQEEQSVKLTTQ